MPAPHMDPPRLIGNTGEYGEFVLSTALPPDASGKAHELRRLLEPRRSPGR